jgi:hypothetical protein
MITIVADTVIFYSKRDEMAFYTWLDSIPSVGALEHSVRKIFIDLNNDVIPDDDITDLIGLFRRYGLEMRQLERLLTQGNAGWFKDPKAPWYYEVFEKEEDPEGPQKRFDALGE